MKKQIEMIKIIQNSLNKMTNCNDQERNMQEQNFIQLYDQVKYQCLDMVNRPFIFAYSALIDNEVEMKIKKYGFDQCFNAPMNMDAFNNEILPLLEH